MSAFYNEFDPFAAQWLRNLIDAGYIAPGIVDERKIQEIEAWELHEFTQVHFFAGIGVWSLALRAAGWPDDQPIWTGSCPCQPFSAAGQRKGTDDERHLWPFFYSLIEQCRPPIVIGEQVASKDGLGWLDLVSADLEKSNYAFGAVDLCAAGFRQAHIRQRLYFVGLADAMRSRARNEPGKSLGAQAAVDGSDGGLSGERLWAGREGSISGLADMQGERRHRGKNPSGTAGRGSAQDDRAIERMADDDAGLQGRAGMLERPDQRALGTLGMAGGLADTLPTGRGTGAGIGSVAGSGPAIRLDNSDGSRHVRTFDDTESNSRDEARLRLSSERCEVGGNSTILHSGQARSLDDADWLLCRNPAGEPSWRPVESGTFPLRHGVASRMGKLRAYGNALDFQTAKGFAEVVAEIAGIRPMTEYDL